MEQKKTKIVIFDKLINKLYVGKTIKKDRFSYEFISSSINSDYNRVNIRINVITPKKGQSYFKGALENDVREIISKNVEPFIGKTLYNLYFYVDGHDYEDIFISDEDKRKIFENLSKINEISILNNNIKFKAKVSFKEPKNYPWYKESYEGPIITFSYDIYDIRVNGERPGPNFGKDDKKLSILSQNINELLMDSDRFRENVEEAVINALEPSMRILDDYEYYYTVNYYIDKIDEIRVSDNVWGDFTYDLFT